MGAPCSESTRTSWVVFLCRALIASFLSRSTLTSIVPTNGQFLSCSFSSQVEQVIITKPCTNITRIAKAALHMLPGKSSLDVRSVCPVCSVCPGCPGFPLCPVDHDYHKVNRCLARYSPRATTTNRPINRALNKPGPN